MESAFELRRCLAELESKRRYYEPTWDEITDLVMPSKGSYTQKTSGPSTYERRNFRRLDSTATIAHRTLVSKVVAELTNPGTRWFDYRVSNPEIDKLQPVRVFLQNVSDLAYNVLKGGSFLMAHIETTIDWAGYGTGAMMVERAKDKMIFKAVPLRELYVEEDSEGKVSTVFRKFKFTHEQAEEFFGEDALPAAVMEASEKDPYCMLDFVHAVEPNEDFDPTKKNQKFFKFKSTYFMEKGNEIIEQGFFKRMPYKVPRFWKRTGECYGGSCAVDSLPDIRMLNALVKVGIECTQKKAAPAWLLAHDSVIAPLKVVPNGTNYGGISPDGRELVKPMPTGDVDLSALQNLMEKTMQAIRASFFVDPLMNRENSIRTAAEVAKRSSEETSGLSPFISRFQVEYLEPVLDDVLAFVLESHPELEIPAELKDHILEVDYSSPLAKTQRGQELNNVLQFSQIFQVMAQADPEMNMYLNKAAHLYNLADLFGIPFDILKSEDEVAAVKQSQAQAQQAQQLMQGATGVADAAAKLGSSGLITRQDFGAPVVPGSI